MKKNIAKWEKEKADKLKKLDGFENLFPNMTLKELKLTDEYKEWRDEVSNYYNDLMNDLKEQLQDEYLKTRQNQLPDYPIFMAIADDIGYDATGKSTGDGDGDLDVIREELNKFIEAIEVK